MSNLLDLSQTHLEWGESNYASFSIETSSSCTVWRQWSAIKQFSCLFFERIVWVCIYVSVSAMNRVFYFHVPKKIVYKMSPRRVSDFYLFFFLFQQPQRPYKALMSSQGWH